MAAPKKLGKPGESDSVKQLVEVPRAMVAEMGILMSWDEVLGFADDLGWRVQATDAFSWCAPDHALFRNGDGRMKGTPVLFFQNYSERHDVPRS